MGLVQVATNTVSGSVSSVILTGINSDDVYMVAFVGMATDTDNVNTDFRITKSGSAQSDNEYDAVNKDIKADASFGTNYQTNDNHLSFANIGTGESETANGIFYLYNFNNSSEFSFVSYETVNRRSTSVTRGLAGGLVHTVASASDGVQFFMSSGNITGGTFTLYKVV
tara:strand:+ start:136 stop:639 length:504 start_codon:yes stop_codon:yes gene_type:complete